MRHHLSSRLLPGWWAPGVVGTEGWEGSEKETQSGVWKGEERGKGRGVPRGCRGGACPLPRGPPPPPTSRTRTPAPPPPRVSRAAGNLLTSLGWWFCLKAPTAPSWLPWQPGVSLEPAGCPWQMASLCSFSRPCHGTGTADVGMTLTAGTRHKDPRQPGGAGRGGHLL